MGQRRKNEETQENQECGARRTDADWSFSGPISKKKNGHPWTQITPRPRNRCGLCTAVGLDLSNYGERRMTPEGVEPSVEVKYYSDESFPFSVKSRDEILAENASLSYSVPWHGCREDDDELQSWFKQHAQQLKSFLMTRKLSQTSDHSSV